MKSTFLIFLIFFSFNLNAQDKQKQLIQILNKEISISTNLLIKSQYQDTQVHLKQLESMYELTKIYYEIEHSQYVKTRNKEFKKTKILAADLDKSGKKYLSQNKINDYYIKVLHLLASNQIYYLNNNDRGADYLKTALSHPIKSNSLKTLITETMADLYFNNDRFFEAQKLYQDLLKTGDPKNYNKYRYNLAWCHLKNENTDKGIDGLTYIIENNKTNQEDRFFKLSMEHLPQFLVLSSTRRNNIDFIRSLDNEQHSMTITYAKLLIRRGHFDIGMKALSFVKIAKITDRLSLKTLIEIQSTLFEQKRPKEFLKISLDLLPRIKPLEEKAEEKIIYISNIANYLNASKKDIYQKEYDPSLNYMMATVSMIQYLLKILAYIDVTNAADHYYFLGELSFFQKKYRESLSFYKKAVEISKNKTQKEKILNAMLNSLSKLGTGPENTPFYIYTYETFLNLKINPELSKKIYEKLNNLYLGLEKGDKSKILISNFSKVFENEKELKNSMILALMDLFSNKNIPEFSKTLGEMRRGLFSMDEENITKIYIGAGLKLFNDTTKLLKEGKREEAHQKFVSYYEEENFGFEIRSKSAYNLILISIDENDDDKTLLWTKNWIALFVDNKKNPPSSESENFINYFFGKGEIENAAEIAQKLFQIYCDKKEVKVAESFFRESVLFHHSLHKTERIYQDFEKSKFCNINEDLKFDLFKTVLENYKTPQYISSYIDLNNEFINLKDKKYSETILENNFNFYLMLKVQNHSKQDKILDLMLENIKMSALKTLETLKIQKEVNLNIITAKIASEDHEPLVLPMDIFSKTLETRLSDLDATTKEIEGAIKDTHPVTTYFGLKLLIEQYELLSNDLKGFIDLNKIDKALKDDLTNLLSGMKGQITSFKTTQLQIIQNNFSYFQKMKNISNSEVETFYHFENFSTPMTGDFGGLL